MSVTPAWKLYISNSNPASNFIDITPDVRIANTVRAKYGIWGNDFTDRVADTGEISFTLNNSADNSVGSAGYYTPGHTNAMINFGPGLAVRLDYIYNGGTAVRFLGYIPPDGIRVTTGTNGRRSTHVTALDWMEQAAITDVGQLAYQGSIGLDDIVGTVAYYGVNRPPWSGTALSTGISEFNTVHDGSNSRTKAMTLFHRAALSEMGYVYIQHGTVGWEMLRAENRQDRNEVLYANAPVATLSNVFLEETAESSRKYNYVTVKVYPFSTDSSNQVLFGLESPIKINNAQREVIIGRFTDPNNSAVGVTCIDAVTPVGTTDYAAFVNNDGSGANLTSGLTVTTEIGAYSTKYIITNNSGQDGYITTLQQRGKAVYTYDPVTATVGDIADELPDSPNTIGTADFMNMNTIGAYELFLDMKYHSNLEEAVGIAKNIMTKIVNAPPVDLNTISFYANRDATLMQAVMDTDIGSHIRVTEDQSGISAKDYFINGIEYRISAANIILVRWLLAPGSYTTVYWRLGVAGRSELSTTAFLAV